MQGVWGAQIKIITYFITDELRLPIIQILIVDVVNYLKIVSILYFDSLWGILFGSSLGPRARTP